MFTYILLHRRISTKHLFTTVIIYNNWQDISLESARYIVQIEDIHRSISRMTRYIKQIDKTYRSKQQDISIKSARYIIQIEDMHHSISKMTRYIIQIDKMYQLNQQDISLKLAGYIVKIASHIKMIGKFALTIGISWQN